MTISAEIGTVRPITSRDLQELDDLLGRDPVASCFVAARVAVAGADPWRLGGELLGYFDDGRLASALYLGANLVPVATSEMSRAAFVSRLRMQPRRCSSFVGPAQEVLDLWRLLEPMWGPARDIRDRQPLMALGSEPAVDGDPRVRVSTPKDLDLLLPACVDMFTSEVGVSPVAGGMTNAYRMRIGEIIDQGRSFSLIENGEVIFKAEVGAVGRGVSQVQGVWVAPAYRGLGMSAACMASVVSLTRRSIAPIVSLYVNDFNTAARKSYRRVGFTEVGEFATVLF